LTLHDALPIFKKLESNTTRHNDLQRELKEAEDNYQLYAKKREEARITDELDRQKITNVSIAEAATAAQIPSSPNRPLNLVLGVVLAAFLSLGSVFSAEMLSDAVYTPRQLEGLTGAPVLATRSEEHTSELQSRGHLVCRLLLEKKKTLSVIRRSL